MSIRILIVMSLLLIGVVPAASAQGVPPALAAGVVRSYFDAFRRQDVGALAGVTTGKAQSDTRSMLDRIHDEAKKNNVGVELQVKTLKIAPSAEEAERTAVGAEFNINVVAKKWFVSKVAKVISGRATFYVGKNLAKGDGTAAKIVGLELSFN